MEFVFKMFIIVALLVALGVAIMAVLAINTAISPTGQSAIGFFGVGGIGGGGETGSGVIGRLDTIMTGFGVSGGGGYSVPAVSWVSLATVLLLVPTAVVAVFTAKWLWSLV